MVSPAGGRTRMQGMSMATVKNLHFLAAVVFTLNGLAGLLVLRGTHLPAVVPVPYLARGFLEEKPGGS